MTAIEEQALNYASTIKVDPNLAPVYQTMVKVSAMLGYIKGAFDTTDELMARYADKINRP